MKTEYYREKISCASNDQVFKMINGLFRVKALQLLPSHESLSTPAETFSNYFHSKIEKMRSELEQSDYITNDLLINEQPSICQSSFLEFNQVLECFVSELIIKTPGKSCTLDPVPTAILKRNVELLSAAIATIINTSLASGVFPKALKQGLVRPSINKHPIINTSLASGVFPKALKQGLVRPSINKHPIINTSLASGVFPKALKQGLVRPSIRKPTLDKEAYSSYRPITNTAFVSKLLERVASTQFMSYLTEHELIAKFRSAYRRFRSSETAMVRVLNDILLTIDCRQEAVLVLLDMSSAFDTTDHSLLLQRLRDRYGVGGTALSWFESYLTDRTQSVTVGNVTSAPQRLIYDVPQGSVLGPVAVCTLLCSTRRHNQGAWT